MRRPPPRSTLFPYTTLFRSSARRAPAVQCRSCAERAPRLAPFLIQFPVEVQPFEHELDGGRDGRWVAGRTELRDRKSTRLNSSHVEISYAVFCLKKKISTTQADGRSTHSAASASASLAASSLGLYFYASSLNGRSWLSPLSPEFAPLQGVLP